MEFLKSASKQVVIIAVVALVAFLVAPALMTTLAIGFAAGAIVGNLFPAFEGGIEKLIAKARDR